MTIPKYDKIMLPLLKLHSDQKNHSTEESYNYVYEFFKLSEKEINEMLFSGKQTIINNRVGWAKTYLTKAGLLEKTDKAQSKITKIGLEVLEEKPKEINREYLKRFPGFKDFIKSRKKDKSEVIPDESTTPIDKLEDSYNELRNNLANELLATVKNSSPEFFENLVIDLLLKMGYGGSRKDAAEALGKVGDEGVDGLIKEDKLGLDVIYIQAKKWDGPVGRPDIQRFVGALEGQKANKGILITTSGFPPSAVEYISKISTKVVLIDGEALVNYMIDNDIGVTLESSYEVKKIDTDYFVE
jgi:restriction system protein